MVQVYVLITRVAQIKGIAWAEKIRFLGSDSSADISISASLPAPPPLPPGRDRRQLSPFHEQRTLHVNGADVSLNRAHWFPGKTKQENKERRM